LSKQTDYTPEEWKIVSAAPVMAGLLVTISDVSGPIGTAKEAFAVVKGVTETAKGTTNELIKAIAEQITQLSRRPDMPELPGDLAGARSTLIEGCKRAVSIVAQKSPSEGEEYKRWLTELAQKTSEASKEGGFLGFGGTQVSDEESAAVKELTSALGMSAKA
jgi:hypothetical protein